MSICHINIRTRIVSYIAAYQLVFHNHFFRRKSKHHTAFVLGIVGSLIRRIDKYSVIKRHGHCTLRLQKGMFRPRSFIMSGHFIFRVGDHFFCISSDQMLMGEYISIQIPSWGVGTHRRTDAAVARRARFAKQSLLESTPHNLLRSIRTASGISHRFQTADAGL